MSAEREQDLDAAFERCGSGHEQLRECVLACRRAARRALDAELCRVLERRGRDTQVLCARELTAKLGDITACDLLQVISMGRKDVVIEVVHGALVSRIWCAGGEIVDAASGCLRGEAAAYRILALDSGELLADFRFVERPRAIATSTQELMLEALRRKDECAVLLKRLGGARRVYSSVPGAAALASVSSLESALLDAFTPCAAIDAVLARSARGDLEILQTVAALVERGCLVANDIAAASAQPHAAAIGGRWKRRLRQLGQLGQLGRLGRLGRLGQLGQLGQLGRFGRELGHLAIGHARFRSSAWAALGACAVVGIGAALLCAPGEARVSEPSVPQQSTLELSATPPSRPSTALGTLAPTRSFAVSVAVEPPQAGLWLDGTRIATGVLSMVLARDGRLHELRIDAPGHTPQTLLFRDVSPPRAIVLALDPSLDR